MYQLEVLENGVWLELQINSTKAELEKVKAMYMKEFDDTDSIYRITKM